MKIFKRDDRGFTLVEVLIVVILVAILAAIAVPKYMQMVKGARASDAKVQINAIMNAAEIYEQEVGTWPSDLTLLEEQGYVELQESTKRAWTFALIGDQQIQATSTAEMRGGPGNVVTYNIQNGSWSGYGFPKSETGE
ncbi:MAG: prepilin-type N-terminal cleavage/methylation domain-containing protein [Calditrichaeota bacterium]|nr:prepilin-type N-terminal cleavage/methylation domain-containing protein [Candidatus Cloacimonadota bacterium]MCB1046476.1 prepilin-type N-terminal cleavage/methylation domain-containing protein [Calditrichota bacterium]MCB9472463.1 prepilin-type N-terminal cleavage/methylation domain-containing protein [Candidatus Delongbacteria bacterium]